MSRSKRWGPTLIRIVLGIIFIKHGWGKVQGMWNWIMSGAEWSFVGHVEFMPVLPPVIWAVAATLAEFVGGIFVVVGFYTRFAAAFIGIVMIAAIFGVHLPAGDSVEFQVALLTMALSLILTGPGRYSIKLKK